MYDVLNNNLRRIIEADLRKVWIQEHHHMDFMKGLYVHSENDKKDTTQTNPLSVRHLQAAFLILGTGLLLSFCTFILEIFVFGASQKIRRKY